MENVDKLLNTMKTQNIKPKPKWQFTLKNALIVGGVIVSVVFGALAFSVVLFSIQQLGFDLIAHMSHTTFEFFLGILPFLWIGAMLIFLFLAMLSVRNSSKGYKFSPVRLLIYNSTFSVLLGVVFFISGGAGWLETSFETNIEFYKSVEEKKVDMWSMPESGYLSGTITSVHDSTLVLIDFQEKQWQIDFAGAFIPKVITIEIGEKIKLTGKITREQAFKASDIRPWGGNKRMNDRPGKEK